MKSSKGKEGQSKRKNSISVNPTDRLVFELEMDALEYNSEKMRALKKEISDKYGVPQSQITIEFKAREKKAKEQEESNDVCNADNVQDPMFQRSLFRMWMKENGVDDSDFDEIEKIDERVNSFIDFDKYAKYKNYKFKYVKWKNYLSYGDDNMFDFSNVHGLVLLTGEPANQSGKTTFAIDLLRFALFGKADKSPKLDMVFNIFLPEATEVVVEAGIEIDSVDYVIRRTVSRPSLARRSAKSKCSQKVEYYKVSGDDMTLIENCEGESSTQTSNIIKESVGSVEDYDFVVSASSYNLSDLTKLGNADRGRLFSKWLGLQTIEQKETIAKQIWKDNFASHLISNKYDRNTLASEIEEHRNAIEGYDAERKDREADLEESKKKMEARKKSRDEQSALLRNVKPELLSIDVTTLESGIEREKDDLSAKRMEFARLKEEYLKIKGITFDQERYSSVNADIKVLEKEAQELKIANAELRTEVMNLKKDNDRINSLIGKGVCPTCGQKIDLELQTGFIGENDARIAEITSVGKKNNERIMEIEEKLIAALSKERESLENDRATETEKQKLELRLTAMKANIDKMKLSIEALERKRQDIEDNKENIRVNNEINAMVRIIDEGIRTETAISERLIREIQSYVSSAEGTRKLIADKEKLISEIIEEENVIRNWNLYFTLVGKNGIVKTVLKRALPIINKEVSRILYGICDFEVFLDIDDKNNVSMELVRDGINLDLGACASGFEGTFASLALRSALASISSMSKPNFLCLDEIDSTIASCNYANLSELYRRILKNYQFIIHIAHNELLEDIHDQKITVHKDGNVSRIDPVPIPCR